MSAETLTWLRENTLIGNVAKRGPAWHAKRDGDNPNHFAGPVPLEKVRELIGFGVEPAPVFVPVVCDDIADAQTIDNDGRPVRFEQVPGHIATRRVDTGAVFGFFSDSYRVHNYEQWLIDHVGAILDVASGELEIGSAVLLRGGAQAAVQMEIPEGVTIGGEQYRPFLAAMTSCDGSLATQYTDGTVRIQCDNTLRANARHASHKVKIRHTSRSLAGGVHRIREGLELYFERVAVWAQDVERWLAEPLTDGDWAGVVDIVAPKAEAGASARAQGNAQRKRDALHRIWNADPRVVDIRGTAWGAVQTVSTYNLHERKVTGVSRDERNLSNFLTGKSGREDVETFGAIERVTGRPMLATV